MQLKWAVVVVALCVVVTVAAVAYAAGKVSDVPEVIRAQRFEAVDEEGRIRARLGVKGGVPELALLDAEGNTRIGLGVDDSGRAILLLCGKEEARAILLWVGEDLGGPGLALRDANNTGRLWLTLNPNGNPVLMMNDKTERLRLFQGVKADGSPRVELSDEEGKVVWWAP